MLWTRVRRVCLAPLLSAALVSTTAAGCDDSNADPSPLPTKSTSSAPTTTPTDEPSPPELPDEAKGTSAAAAKAFARYWIEALNYAGPAGDTSVLRPLFTKECTACGAVADLIEDVEDNGGFIEGRGWEVQSTRVVSQTASKTVVDIVVDVTPQTIVPSMGAEPEEFKGGRRLKTFWLVRSEGEWAVSWLEQPS